MTDAANSPYSSSSSLATPRPSADAADEPSSPAAPIFQTLSEIMYASHGRSLKALAVLSLGLKNNDGSPTFDPSVLPWSAALRPSALKMTAKDLRDEVKRRSEAAGDDALTAPRPSNCKHLSWNDARDVENTSPVPVASVVHPSLLLRLPQQQQQQEKTQLQQFLQVKGGVTEKAS